MEDIAPDLVALTVARQHATQAREAAERAVREAQRAEIELAIQEERAIAAAIFVKRQRLAARIHVAEIFTQSADHAAATLQAKLQAVAAERSEAQARATVLRAALHEQEERLRAAEATERALQTDLGNVESAAVACRTARDTAQAALFGIQLPGTPPAVSVAA